MRTLHGDALIEQIRKDQAHPDVLRTLVGQKLVGVEHHGGHGAEYEFRFADGRVLYVTKSDHTDDLVCKFKDW